MANLGETPYSKYWIDEGILYFVYKPIDYLDLATAKLVVDRRIQFQQGVVYPIFCDTRGVLDTSKPARDYLAQKGSLLAGAVAIYDNRPLARLMMQFYTRRNRPLAPSRIFTDREEAIAFLKNHVKP